MPITLADTIIAKIADLNKKFIKYNDNPKLQAKIKNQITSYKILLKTYGDYSLIGVRNDIKNKKLDTINKYLFSIVEALKK